MFHIFVCASFFDNHLLQTVSKVATESNVTSNFGPIVCRHTRRESERRTKSLNTPLSSVNSVLFDFKRNDLPLYYNLVLWVMYPLNVWKWFSWFGVCFVLFFLKALLEMCFSLKVSPFVATISLSSRCIKHVVRVAEWLFLMGVTPSPTPLPPPIHADWCEDRSSFFWGLSYLTLNSLLLVSSLIPRACGSRFNWTVENTWFPMKSLHGGANLPM